LGVGALLWLAGSAAAVAQSQASAQSAAAPAACAEDPSGLALPAGFCASVFADNIGHARHLVVTPNGVVYVNTWSGRYYANGAAQVGGYLVALRDSKGTGVADVNQRFGKTAQAGGHGGTGIALYHEYLYAESNDRIVRYVLTADSIVPRGAAEVVVSGLPLSGDHPMHPFIIDADGRLYVDVASATNSCQVKNRTLKSPGIQPCEELKTRGGIWQYEAMKLNQRFSSAGRYATGLRNAEGMALDSAGHGMWVTQHGRDQLHDNWPDLYSAEQEATLPAEGLVHLQQGGDYGWPECYYDSAQHKLVLAPEYGGDGGKAVGVCAQKLGPVADFPAHWAPNDLLLYEAHEFPAHYQQGAFIAFHGSWDRAPYAQGGYNVVFQPLSHGKASGRCEIFADGFAGAQKNPGKAAQRPSGLALGPDGALYIADDVHGRIYRVVYAGAGGDTGRSAGPDAVTPCPDADAPAGPMMLSDANPPEGVDPDAGAAPASRLPVAPGATQAMVDLGRRVYRGQAGGAGCSGCHGNDGGGTPLGPTLKAHQWLWSDGSYAAIQRTITEGVSEPKQYRSPMPAMGGAQLSAEQVSAVAAYVWGLSH
jgi:glucose/arabinose dehydrogenase